MNLLQRLRFLPARERRFGFWRTMVVGLATGAVLGTVTILGSPSTTGAAETCQRRCPEP
jgi:hypothetical protein